MKIQSNQSLNSLQAGRAIAALAVLAFHLSRMMGDAGFSQVGRNLTWRGDLGVDFFFVLSGFIIAHAHDKDIDNPQALTHFLYRRFVRLYPIYWLFTVIVIAGLFLGGRHNHTSGDPAEWTTAITLLRFSDAPLPIHPAWTLVHEIAFYLVFSLMILNRKVGWLVMAAWMMWCAVSYHYCTENNRTAILTYSSAINMNFFVGMAAYYCYRRKLYPTIFLLCGIALFFISYACDMIDTPFSPLTYAVSFGLIISGISSLESKYKLYVPRPLIHIGNSSYVLYISHELIVVVLLRYLHKYIHVISDVDVYFTTFIFAVILSILVHMTIEKPVLKLMKGRFAQR